MPEDKKEAMGNGGGGPLVHEDPEAIEVVEVVEEVVKEEPVIFQDI